AIWLKPLMMKAPPVPTNAINNPAILGPITLAPLKILELSAMAEGSSSKVTISGTKACRAGESTALTVPKRNDINPMLHKDTMSKMVSKPRIIPNTMADDCEYKRILLLGYRSTITPPQREKSSDGAVESAVTKPI